MDLEQVPKAEEPNSEQPKSKAKRGRKPGAESEPKNKTTKSVGNIRSDVEIDPKDKDFVLFYSTNEGAIKLGVTTPRGWTPPKRLERMTKINFYKCFASNYTDNGVFQKVNNAETVIRLFLNLKGEHIKESIEFELSKAETADQRQNILNFYLDKFSILNVNGSNKYIEKGDIIHCPGITDLDKLPEECLRNTELKY